LEFEIVVVPEIAVVMFEIVVSVDESRLVFGVEVCLVFQVEFGVMVEVWNQSASDSGVK
jgi:hypothetical protein